MNKDQFKLNKITEITKLHTQAMPLINGFLAETDINKRLELAVKIKFIQVQIDIVLSIALPQYSNGSAIKENGAELIVKP